MIDVHRDIRPSDTLAVAFTGLMDRLGGIPFEFHRTVARSPWAGLLVRDTRKIWYQYDEADICRFVDEVKQAAAEAGANRIVCLGNSMGGFGALLFGPLIGAAATIAFAPQTCIDPSRTRAIEDYRWRKWQRSIPAYPRGDLAVIDPGASRITLVCGADQPLDCSHVSRFPYEAQKIFVPGAAHGVAKALGEAGQLQSMIEQALARA